MYSDGEEACINVVNAYHWRYNHGEINESSRTPEVNACHRREFELRHRAMMNLAFEQRPLVITPELLNNRLPLTTIHKFCNKGSAVYCNPSLSSSSRNRLFWEAWYTWQMPGESCLVWGSFALQFLGNWGEDTPKDVDGVLEMHHRLCKLVEERQGRLDVTDMMLPSNSKEVLHHGNFSLTPSFQSCFIIIDQEDWYSEGGLFVRTPYEYGLELLLLIANTSEEDSDVVAQKNVLRMTFVDAVDLVIEMQLDVETEEQKVLNRKLPLRTLVRQRVIQAKVHM